MHTEWLIAPLAQWRADAILFYAFEGAAQHLPGVQRWLREQPSWATQLNPLKDFTGKLQETAVYYGSPGQLIPRVLCVGLGPAESLDLEKLRTATADLLRKCRELHISRPAIPLMAFDGLSLEADSTFREAIIGAISGLYRYEVLKTREESQTALPEVLLILNESAPTEGSARALEDASATAAGIALARDLVTAPSNRATPAFLVQTARELAERYRFEIQVIDLEGARKLGMGLFAAVAQGSQEPAYLIVLEHRPAGTENDQPLLFAGKGITFDTGGISIKPSNKMEAMKHDMAGAGAVLGAFKIIGETGLNKRIVGILPCTENMPDGKAYKPGDVLRSMAGLTVEVISTDAEGRLILGDALAFALRYQPLAIVDIATLTGACIVALGDRVGAVMGNNENLTRRIQEIGMRVGDRLWPLPLWDFYFEDIKSDVADFKNVGGRKGGAIIGGIFLKQFVPDALPWAHIDIAGPAWTEKDLSASPKGATGFGVRLLAELATDWS
ncbi:MAG: leucyl aminopeptidase [Desulforhabdus sp.]|jgi:leucyl aminopeptidase|nr:leucyl aminopeptidase [Desulforhabdus sp.]